MYKISCVLLFVTLKAPILYVTQYFTVHSFFDRPSLRLILLPCGINHSLYRVPVTAASGPELHHVTPGQEEVTVTHPPHHRPLTHHPLSLSMSKDSLDRPTSFTV